MKKTTLLLALLLVSFYSTLTAQTSETPTQNEERPEVIRDRLVIDVFHSFWMRTPKEINTKKMHPGFNLSLMWDFKQNRKGSVSFGLGLGVTYHSQFSDAQLRYNAADDVTRYAVLPLAKDSIKFNRMDYISCNIPLEFRYRNQSNGFKFTIGVRVGLIAEVSQTYKGVNPDLAGNQIKIKSFEAKNKQPFNFDAYMRMGWKHVSFYYSYQVTNIYQKEKGPQMSPMSVGVSWNIF